MLITLILYFIWIKKQKQLFLFLIGIFLLALAYLYTFYAENYDAHPITIQYGILITSDKKLLVYENGAIKKKTTYVSGDSLRVERVNNTILYKKNRIVFHTSEKKYSGKLLVDAAIDDNGGSISNARIFDENKGRIINVNWTNLLGVTSIGNTITKVNSVGWGNSGAISNNILDEGTNGWVEIIALQTNTSRIFGFSPSNLNTLNTLPLIVKKKFRPEISSRWYSIRNSIQIFLENPITGIGMGNWYTEAYKYDLSKIYQYNNPYRISRWGNHNMYSQLIAEIGFIGFIAFLYPIVLVLWDGFRKSADLTSLQKSAYASFIGYLVSCLFYRDASHYELHFSGIELLAFCSLGLISTGSKSSNKFLSKWIYVPLIIFSFLCLWWFIYSNQMRSKYILARKLFENNQFSPLLIDDCQKSINTNSSSSEDLNATIDSFYDIYHPVFKTTHGFYGDFVGSNRSIALQLAILYRQQENYNDADKYFQKALELAPNDEYVLVNYSYFLLRIKKEPSKAKIYALRAYFIQKNSYDYNILLSKIAIAEKKYEEAKKYMVILGSVKGPKYESIRTLLNVELFIAEKKYKKAEEYLKSFEYSVNHECSAYAKYLRQQILEKSYTRMSK